jgi:hypothetical protein
MLNNKYFIYLCILTSGILLGVFFCDFSYFTFEKTIKISDLVSLVVTSTIGIYIATTVSRVFTKNNSEKEFLINEIKSTLKIINQILDQANERSLPFNKTVSNFKKANESLLLLKNLLKSSHCSSINIDKISRKLVELRNLTTRISPINGVINLNSSDSSAIKASTLILKTELYKLIFEINKQ